EGNVAPALAGAAKKLTASYDRVPGIQIRLAARWKIVAAQLEHPMPSFQDDRPIGAVIAGLPILPPPDVKAPAEQHARPAVAKLARGAGDDGGGGPRGRRSARFPAQAHKRRAVDPAAQSVRAASGWQSSHRRVRNVGLACHRLVGATGQWRERAREP